jgi:NADPH:quinone reductase-like Zn-dependent oxidoreductase
MDATMRAVVIEGPGTPADLSVASHPVPEPGQREALVRLTAAALNHRDLSLISGRRGGWGPFVLGSDGAGRVAAVGPDVDTWHEGDEVVVNACLSCGRCTWCRQGEQSLCDGMRILGGPDDGTFADYVRVPAINLHPAPAHVDLATAAALPLALATAWRALIGRGGLRPGESLLVHGIGGGVATYALRIAASLGCRVIVTSGSTRKLDDAAALGAAAGIDYRSEDVAKRVSDLTAGRGVDLVLDAVGPATLPASLAAVRKGGRIVHLGSHSGAEVTIENRVLYHKQVALIGTTMSNDREFNEAMAFVDRRRIAPVISHRFPLERIADAATVLERGEQAGKVLLEIAP